MKNWHYGINGLYRSGHYSLEEAPWYVFFLNWLSDRVCSYLVPPIPLPPIPMTLKEPMCIKEEGVETTKTNWHEYYGGLRDVWHLFIHTPVFNWCHDHTRTVYVETSYAELKEQFYEQDKEFFDEDEERIKEIRAEDATDMLKEHDRVELLFDTVANMGLTMEEEYLKAGMRGTIISVHEDGKAFDVEFIQEKTMPVIITLNADQVREAYDLK